jgi:putative restriction endonuclease
MAVGVARLNFADADLTKVTSAEWRGVGQKDFEPRPPAQAEYIAAPAPPYVRPSDSSPKKAQFVRERPGQAKFRRTLKAAYQHRCCICGCTVTEALEGAHIDPYRSPDSDNLRNGLLLRRDLHTLFDAHLISIDPASFTVRIAPLVREEVGYEKLDGAPLLLPKDPTHKPDAGALGRHWERFLGKHGLVAPIASRIAVKENAGS